MRHYILSFERLAEKTAISCMSADEALRMIQKFRCEGWRVRRIERGSTVISHAELTADAEPAGAPEP